MLAISALASGVVCDNILSTIGFTNCGPNEAIQVQRVDIAYNHGNKTITFDVEGTSTKVQNVTAELRVTAYGNEIYANTFDPCHRSTFVSQLCPVPEGTFGARGVQEIPAEFADMVPNIAFQVPDIAAQATLKLNSKEDGGESVACIQSRVTNGKTTDLAVVSYVACGVAGLALIATGVSALGAVLSGGGAAAGGGTPSPSFTETVGWFQGMAMNGMLSVNYPPVYRSFTKNFAFSTGLLPWSQLQQGIDDFRGATGGDLTKDSFELLRKTTLVFPDESTSQSSEGFMGAKRALQDFSVLLARQIETSVGGEGGGSGGSDDLTKTVEGIQAYVEQLSVPQSNTFMTVLLIVAIVVAAIVVSILLVKVVLEFWALFGSFPQSLAGFREHYWGSIARAITSLILLLYGVWVLYCVFQFTHGDSWAAKTLAGVTLAIFTGILAFFTWKIWSTARKLKQAEGDPSGLYEKKEIWVKYSLFYDSYKKDYWWLFVPVILYMFAKGCIIAAGNGHGLVQASGQLIVEALLLGLLLWKKPFERRSGNIIHIVIQVVRVLSVACILVFVEQFGIRQTTQTITGVVLIAVQSALTGILAILIIWNAVEACCKTNPHRKRRKEMEKMQRDMDTLTPLDARNSLLLDRKDPELGPNGETTFSMASTVEKRQSIKARSATPDVYDKAAAATYNSYRHKNSTSNGSNGSYRALTTQGAPMYGHQRDQSRENLVSGAAPVGQDLERQPTLPNVGSGGWDSSYDNGGAGYSGYRQYRGF
ncbi:TRP-domain-containing protein [Sodiomyces alkalinus F11]|uniref:TRP-domain-containing protein n=1 Tax=Sodiomyces alkalinus (strain CBS 110278 / VKM F-3762 / F11) TaxID=1314773 RepID=A0A3N2PR20_SODAK|nr:TRP-domain-containing protein [Sodiomyces alkalinus F11]ROT36920.1 TRP-domain-containing protein [Sodiomyces alkalinus F11]